ncbi:MAG: hypothetical protein AMXMBFR50_26580, partial [Ignavibacterium album]
IFTKFLNKYQTMILTHDKVFFEFVKLQIRQKSELTLWQISELYEGKTEDGQLYPVYIDGDLGYLEKAKKYFEAKDYTASAVYIRKEFDKLISERLPKEHIISIDGEYKNLSHLWKICLDRYKLLKHPITKDIEEAFAQTKLMLLNPQAHHSLSYPVYRLELLKAFKLISDIQTKYPVPASQLVLSKGMKLLFEHPTLNYSCEIELCTDFSIDGLNGQTSIILPKCKTLTWQYQGTEFWDFNNSTQLAIDEIRKFQKKTQRIDKTIDFLINHLNLNITKEMIINNTSIPNNIWTLSEVLTKAGISLDQS